MTGRHLIRNGWTRVKEFAPAAMAAALMYGGIHQIFSVLKQVLGIGIMRLINTATEMIFPGYYLPRYGAIPWPMFARVAAVGVIIAAVGMFIGLWVQARSGTNPQHSQPKQNPRRSEG
ncbi:MAG: hypothetical protein ACLPHP_13965 [Candidatus Sulfotelmatobacter sp.]